MPLSAGAKLGSYEVIAPIGAGGMGEVYRARDTRLQRDVALKVLPELMAADPERKARFEREAQLLASLNHPHVGQIYGVQEVGAGGLALVMELVEGRTLADLIQSAGSGLPLLEAISLAQQIASGLEAAHDRGIIHRDLKPGNVMVNADGQVKVLDFGLGKALAPESSGDASNSPTITLGATQAGMILGTAAYMSPEQAKGRAADRRSDVWSFGCVLFEMLTGRRAFDGEDVSETLASVLKQAPDWNLLPADTPPVIRLIVERCLTKDRASRLPDVGTARFLLTEPSSISQPRVTATAESNRRSISVPVAIAMVAVAIALTAGIAMFLRPAGSGADAGTSTHLSITLPQGHGVDYTAQPLTVSPDGRHVVFAAAGDGAPRLFSRALNSAEVRVIAGTEGALYPFFSPNGEWVGFVAQGKLKKAALAGNAVETLSAAPNTRGGFWGEDGFIYFTLSNVSPIVRVPESGGAPQEVTKLDAAAGEISHRDPQILPGGKAIMFTIWKGPGPDEKFVAVQSLTGDSHKIVVRGGADGRYVPPGYLVYARSDDLLAVTFDLATLEPGKAAPVTLPVHLAGEAAEGAAFAVSTSGVLAYIPADASRLARRLVWVDRTGQVEPLDLPNRIYEQVAIAPDGTRAVVQIIDGSVGLWLLDFARNTLAPLATTGGSSQAPVWTTDGKRVVYRATRNGVRNLYWKSADGTGDEERLTTKPGMLHTPSSASSDGQWVLFSEVGPQSDRQVWRVRLTGTHEVELLSGKETETHPVISPDGKWLAVTVLSADVELYVRPYPRPGARLPISRNGGLEPLWGRDGKSLYFQKDDGFYVVDVTTGSAFSATAPRLLFRHRFEPSANGVTGYGQGKDGRFLRVESVNPARPMDTINVVLNWTEELRRLVR